MPWDGGFAEKYGFDTSKIRTGKSEDCEQFLGTAEVKECVTKKRTLTVALSFFYFNFIIYNQTQLRAKPQPLYKQKEQTRKIKILYVCSFLLVKFLPPQKRSCATHSEVA